MGCCKKPVGYAAAKGLFFIKFPLFHKCHWQNLEHYIEIPCAKCKNIEKQTFELLGNNFVGRYGILRKWQKKHMLG